MKTLPCTRGTVPESVSDAADADNKSDACCADPPYAQVATRAAANTGYDAAPAHVRYADTHALQAWGNPGATPAAGASGTCTRRAAAGDGLCAQVSGSTTGV